MIVDCHTHIFPPEIALHRDRYSERDATFRLLYATPRAKLATAEDLLASMTAGGLDVSVAAGFAWRDAALCREHNDYLLQAAAASAGRIAAFCTLPLASGAGAVQAEAERCLASGAAGFGELRPDSVGADLETHGLGEALAEAAGGKPLLFHVSEPVGHVYAGKEGFALERFYRFVAAHPAARVIGAHWAGGLPFYAAMPEVPAVLTNVWFDTAASTLLYGPEIYARVVATWGAEKILFGSDFPLLGQARSRRRIEKSGLGASDVAAVLGENARRLLEQA